MLVSMKEVIEEHRVMVSERLVKARMKVSAQTKTDGKLTNLAEKELTEARDALTAFHKEPKHKLTTEEKTTRLKKLLKEIKNPNSEKTAMDLSVEATALNLTLSEKKNGERGIRIGESCTNTTNHILDTRAICKSCRRTRTRKETGINSTSPSTISASTNATCASPSTSSASKNTSGCCYESWWKWKRAIKGTG